jgi:predicted nucleotidyltransferase
VDRNIIPWDILESINNYYKLSYKKYYKKEEIAYILSQFYLKSIYISSNFSLKQKIIIENIKQYDEWLREALKRIDYKQKLHYIYKIRKKIMKIKPYVVDVLIHGSIATLDYSPWSDYDLIIIIKDKSITSINTLIKIRRNIVKINKLLYLNDPLQHHGFFIISESDLFNYDENYLPIDTIRNGVSMFGVDKIIIFKINSNKKYWQNKLLKLIYELKSIDVSSLNIFTWKLFCHNMLLIPSLFLETQGIYVYKKHSFELISKYFDKDDLEIIDYLSNIRNKFFFRPWWRVLLLLFGTFWPLVGILSRVKISNYNTREINNMKNKFLEKIIYKINLYTA